MSWNGWIMGTTRMLGAQFNYILYSYIFYHTIELNMISELICNYDSIKKIVFNFLP